MKLTKYSEENQAVTMVTEVIDKLAEDLEKQELEAPGGVPGPQVYSLLLAIYLYQNDLCSAKYLWKRIPASVKNANPELGRIWKVGQKMWLRDFPGVYDALTTGEEWSETVAETMKSVHEAVQKRALQLVGRAYSSISVADFSSFVGLTPEEVVARATPPTGVDNDGGWSMDPNVPGMVLPRKPAPGPIIECSSEDQLYKLTEFVSFLEN
ncbi:hypothetical protein J437_LFUL005659 [Ladona fulva]|uniref:CSN8/PSMD8/EIF3K domain-containing protein n=1 Tax=Ladona fulva TaxID=123851 RepID=A0A8K0JZ67_LADFU|nr:hypothetical protein J437_LFUL005659 [Ladona fulva]